MADATPIKAVFNASNVATGLAEFSTSDTVALSDGGRGVSLSLGTAGQALKVNSGGTALEFGSPVAAAGDLTGTTLASGITASSLTSVGTLTTLTVDNVIINGTTIGHTDDTDLITLADGVVTVAGEVSVTTLDIGGTNVTSTAAELNLVDGITAGTVSASKAVIADSNKDISGFRNLSITGNLTVSGTTTTVNQTVVNVTEAFVFEGATADANETTFSVD